MHSQFCSCSNRRHRAQLCAALLSSQVASQNKEQHAGWVSFSGTFMASEIYLDLLFTASEICLDVRIGNRHLFGSCHQLALCAACGSAQCQCACIQGMLLGPHQDCLRMRPNGCKRCAWGPQRIRTIPRQWPLIIRIILMMAHDACNHCRLKWGQWAWLTMDTPQKQSC